MQTKQMEEGGAAAVEHWNMEVNKADVEGDA